MVLILIFQTESVIWNEVLTVNCAIYKAILTVCFLYGLYMYPLYVILYSLFYYCTAY